MKLTLKYLIIAVLIGCQSHTEHQTSDTEHSEENTVELTQTQFSSAGIQFGKVEMKNLSSTITVNGMLDVPPQNLVSVSALMGGFVKSTDLLQGMRVKKGQTILTIQNPEFINLQRDYLQNKQKLEFLSLEYARQKELMQENVGSKKDYQQVSSEYNMLKTANGALEEQLLILNIEPSSLTESNIKSTVRIISPINGYVTTVNVNLGKYVTPQDVICEIVDTDHLHAELTVYEKDLSKLRKGQKVRFMLVNESNKERLASIYLINHKIETDRTIRVHAHLEKDDPLLVPNMYLKAVIELDENTTTALPNEAIVSTEDKFFVFIKTKEENEHQTSDIHFQTIQIQKGISQNGYTEVTFPTEFDTTGSEIVIKGAYDLLSKMNNTEEGGHGH